MKNIVIKIHSFVDVITNSSTEIFVQSTKSTVDTAKELIAKLLKAAGVTKPVEELFDIYVGKDDTYDDYIDKADDNDAFSTDDDDCAHNELIIKPKNNDLTTINLTEQIQEIFDIYGCMC